MNNYQNTTPYPQTRSFLDDTLMTTVDSKESLAPENTQDRSEFVLVGIQAAGKAAIMGVKHKRRVGPQSANTQDRIFGSENRQPPTQSTTDGNPIVGAGDNAQDAKVVQQQQATAHPHKPLNRNPLFGQDYEPATSGRTQTHNRRNVSSFQFGSPLKRQN